MRSSGRTARLPQKSLDDVLAHVGRGELTAAEVFKAAFPDVILPEIPKRKAIKRSDEGWFNLRRVANLRFRWPGSVPEDHAANGFNGVNGVPIRGARSELPSACGAAPFRRASRRHSGRARDHHLPHPFPS